MSALWASAAAVAADAVWEHSCAGALAGTATNASALTTATSGAACLSPACRIATLIARIAADRHRCDERSPRRAGRPVTGGGCLRSPPAGSARAGVHNERGAAELAVDRDARRDADS